MVATTARYIGLRTYRYRPPTTRRSVGATGAGVPRPSATNRAKAWTRTIAPRMSMISPATRTGAQWASGPRTCHRVSHQGTTPATTPGAAAKNSALPAAAVGLRTLAPQAAGRAVAFRARPAMRSAVRAGPWDSSVRGRGFSRCFAGNNIRTVCMYTTYPDLHTDSTYGKGGATTHGQDQARRPLGGCSARAATRTSARRRSSGPPG